MTYNTSTSEFEEVFVFITTNKNYDNFTEDAKMLGMKLKKKYQIRYVIY